MITEKAKKQRRMRSIASKESTAMLRQVKSIRITYWPWDDYSKSARALYNYVNVTKRRATNTNCLITGTQLARADEARITEVVFSDGKKMSFKPTTKFDDMLGVLKRYTSRLQSAQDMKLSS